MNYHYCSSFFFGFVNAVFVVVFLFNSWFGILQVFFLNGWRWQPFLPSKIMLLAMLAT